MATAPGRGVSLDVVWVVPVRLVVLGGVPRLGCLRGPRPAHPPAAVPPSPASRPTPTPRPPEKPNEPMDEYIARVERELK